MWEFSHLEALKFLREAGNYEDAAELEAHFLQVLNAFGFDRYGCVKFDDRRASEPVVMLATRGMEEWHQHWTAQGYEKVDPVPQLAVAGRPLFTWSQARTWAKQRGAEESPLEQRLWGEAKDAGMQDGLLTQARGPGGEVLAVRMTTSDRNIRPADRPLLDAVAIIFSTMRLRLHEREADQAAGVLTVREQQCLRWASEGMIDAEVAEQLGISAKTVAFHMENAKRKLGARTRLAAYRRALELGHLST